MIDATPDAERFFSRLSSFAARLEHRAGGTEPGGLTPVSELFRQPQIADLAIAAWRRQTTGFGVEQLSSEDRCLFPAAANNGG
jgi:hypothetical protein